MTRLQRLQGDIRGADGYPGCGLSGAQRMRYWKPAPALSGLISGYHLYAVETLPGKRHRDVFQPAWANLRFVLTSGTEWRIRIGEGAWERVGECALFGPSSRVTWTESGPGVVVGAGLTPLGWARLTKASAADWANRITDCEAVFDGTVAALRPVLCGAARDEDLPVLLDAFFIGALARPTRRDPAIVRLDAALLDPTTTTVRAMGDRTGMTARSLERLAARAFGFPPKLLLRRARFLRSLHAIRRAEPAERVTEIDPGYTDYSHFVRDAHDFLGMSPGAFLKLDLPLFAQSARLREQLLGAPAQALGPR